jgi:hypothetical protein
MTSSQALPRLLSTAKSVRPSTPVKLARQKFACERQLAEESFGTREVDDEELRKVIAF